MIPNLFSKEPIPERLPPGMQEALRTLKERHRTKESFLEAAYDLISGKYRLKRLLVLLKFWDLFRMDLESLWSRKENSHLDCHLINFLLRTMLVKSGFFRDSDIELGLTTTWYIVPHQYLHIRLAQARYTDVDCAMRPYGIPFGKHAGGWHCGSFWPK